MVLPSFIHPPELPGLPQMLMNGGSSEALRSKDVHPTHHANTVQKTVQTASPRRCPTSLGQRHCLRFQSVGQPGDVCSYSMQSTTVFHAERASAHNSWASPKESPSQHMGLPTEFIRFIYCVEVGLCDVNTAL